MLTTLASRLSVIADMNRQRQLANTVLGAYLGPRTGPRVLAGHIRRGSGEAITAVMWSSDLRGFTHFSDHSPGDVVIETLNLLFDLQAKRIGAQGGEILKFIGDGVMAYFPADDALFLPYVTNNAVAAARRLIADVEAANEARAAGGADPLRFGVGLHVGPVTFGNIGTEDRLDFTVIGPAVNRASRLEGLTKQLGVPVLASSEFNAASTVPMKSLGQHALRGVPEPVEVFTLPD